MRFSPRCETVCSVLVLISLLHCSVVLFFFFFRVKITGHLSFGKASYGGVDPPSEVPSVLCIMHRGLAG